MVISVGFLSALYDDVNILYDCVYRELLQNRWWKMSMVVSAARQRL